MSWAVVFTLMLALAGCGGGGGGGATGPTAALDTDGDGIPDAVDAFPNDPTRFANSVTVILAGLTAGGGGFSTATAVNTGGQVVGFSENATNQLMAVRWNVDAVSGSVSGAITLNPLAGGTYGAAYGINTSGLTVGESDNGTNIVAAAWAASGTAAAALSMAGFTGSSSAYGVNTGGQIVGEATTTGGVLHAVLWNAASSTPVDLGSLGGATAASSAYAINDGGIVVGESDDASGVTHAVAWLVNSAGAKTLGPVDLGVLTIGDISSIAFGVDSTGRVVGESVTQGGVAHAAMWTLNPATLVPLATGGKTDLGANATAYAINESSRIVGHLGATTDVATVWDIRNPALPNGAVPETTFSQAFAVNNGNLAVGLSLTRAFVAVPK